MPSDDKVIITQQRGDICVSCLPGSEPIIEYDEEKIKGIVEMSINFLNSGISCVRIPFSALGNIRPRSQVEKNLKERFKLWKNGKNFDFHTNKVPRTTNEFIFLVKFKEENKN